MRPFLKWAGNKYRLLPIIKEALPEGERLVEPFLGSGAVFLNTDYDNYLLAEINPDLVHLYELLKNEQQKFVKYSRQFFIPEHNSKESYYDFREKFNTSKSKRKRSALFVYLNRHGFNGLCRYNSSGKYNVPFGQHERMPFPEERMHHFIVKSQQAEFICQDFIHTFQQARLGDVIYCDPPYVPLSPTASFDNYSGSGFSLQQQQQLVDCAVDAANRGIPVLISNHDTALSRELYRDAEIISFATPRFISSDIHNRKPVQELIAIYR